jgi:integrase
VFVFKSAQGCPLNNKTWNDMWNSFKRSMQITAGCKVCQTVYKGGKKVKVVKSILPEDLKPCAPYTLVPPYPIADDLVPYCFRHTFCTDLQDAGVPINVAKDLMGHSSISVTAKIYTHMTDAQMKQTSEKLASFRASQN